MLASFSTELLSVASLDRENGREEEEERVHGAYPEGVLDDLAAS